MQKIELYKRRTWSQSLMTGIDFYQQHLKIIYGNVFKIALPTALLCAIILSNTPAVNSSSTELPPTTPALLIYSIVMLIATSFTFAIISYLIQLYEEGQIKSPRKFQLMEDLFSYTGKIFAVQLIISLLFFLGIYALVKLIAIENLYAVFLLIAILIFLTPLFLLASYPVFFEESSAIESLSKGIKMGFKSWGATFMIGLIVSIIATMIYFFFVLIGLFFSLLGSGLSQPINASFGVLSLFLSLPIPVICLAFHYFSIREANEGVSLKAKIDHFEDL